MKSDTHSSNANMLSWQRAFSFQKFSSKLLTPAVSQPVRHTHELSPRHSPSLSLSFYLSLSLLLSLSLSLSFSFSLSLSLSLSSFLALPFCLQCADKGKAARSRSGDEKSPECFQQKSVWKRCLKRCSSIPGAIPQISRSRQTPRLGEYGREHPKQLRKK